MAAMSGIDCVREQVPLAERTWFKLGGPAQYFAEPTRSTNCRRSSSGAATRGCKCGSSAAARTCWCATKAWPAWSSLWRTRAFANIAIDGRTRDRRRRREAGQRDHGDRRRRPGRARTARRHPGHGRRRAPRQRRQPRRRHRPMGHSGDRHDPQRRNHRARTRATWCSPIARAASMSW